MGGRAFWLHLALLGTITCKEIQTDREIQNALSGYNTGLCAPNFFIL